MGATQSSARMRPSASKTETSSVPTTATSRSPNRACASSMVIRGPPNAKQSSLSWAIRLKPPEDVCEGNGHVEHQPRHRLRVVQIYDGDARCRKCDVARDAHDGGVQGMDGRAAVVDAMDLDLGDRLPLVPFHDNEVAGADPPQELIQGRFLLIPQLVDLGPPAARRDQNLARPRFAVLVRVLPGPVGVEVVVSVLDGRHLHPAGDEDGDGPNQQVGLASPAPPGKSDYAHAGHH